MAHVLRHPGAIVKSSLRRVVIRNEDGISVKFSRNERKIWQDVVSPFLIMHPVAMSEYESMTGGSGATSGAAGDLQAELNALISFKKRLEAEQEDLEGRNLALSAAEEMVIDRLYTVEVAEAQLEQLKVEAAECVSDRNAADLSKRLKDKEFEIEKLKTNLREDQNIVLTQKTELNQLKGELIRDFEQEPGEMRGPRVARAPVEALTDGDQAKMLDKLKNIECLGEQLRERDVHLMEAENILIKRLEEISEREAYLEQHEVEAGIRED